MNNPENKSTSPSAGDTVPVRALAKSVPPQKGPKCIPFIATAIYKAAEIQKTRAGKQQPDTNVTAADEESTSRLITATLALIAGGKSAIQPCAEVRVAADKQIAEFRQRHFDTWAAIAANLCELRTQSKLRGVYSFDVICRQRLGLQRTKCSRLADCHVRLISLPEAYQQALRELRKSATTDVIEKVKEVMAEGVREAQIKNSLSAKFSRKGQQKSPAEVAKLKFLTAVAAIEKIDDRRSYLKPVMEEAVRSVGWTFAELNGVASIVPATGPKTATDFELAITVQ